MKRGKKFLILIVALALAAGGYYGAMKLSEKEAAKQTTEEIKLVDGDVTGLKWTNGGDELELINDAGEWMLAGLDGCPVDQETAAALIDTVSAFTVQSKIEGELTLADYGLDEPVFEATVATAKGDVTFIQGDENTLTGQTYISKSGEAKTVYAADETLEDIFSVSAIDLAKLEELPQIGDATTISIDGKVGQTKDENGVWRSLTGEMSNEVKIEALFDALREVKWLKLVDWTGETALENPVSVKCQWADGEYNLLIGQQTDDGYLAKLPDSNMVYAIDAANAEVILATSDASLRSTELFEADWDGENTITATIGGVSYTPDADATEVIKNIETGELAEPAGSELITLTVNGVSCQIRDYDTENCTATVNGITRLIPADDADKLVRLVKYAK